MQRRRLTEVFIRALWSGVGIHNRLFCLDISSFYLVIEAWDSLFSACVCCAGGGRDFFWMVEQNFFRHTGRREACTICGRWGYDRVFEMFSRLSSIDWLKAASHVMMALDESREHKGRKAFALCSSRWRSGDTLMYKHKSILCKGASPNSI